MTDRPRHTAGVAWLAALSALEAWLSARRIPYSVLGGVAVSAWTSGGASLGGASLDFDRAGAWDATQRVPDIDLLVPRACLTAVRGYAGLARRGDPPLKIDTVAGECYIDWLPGQALSYLTHRRLAYPVPTVLFGPVRAPLLGQRVTTVDPRVLLGTFGTIGGVVRRKDAVKGAVLAAAIASGAAPSGFSEADCLVFARYQAQRRHDYPGFIAAKTVWETAVAALPGRAGSAVLHYASPPAQRVIGRLNRQRDLSSEVQAGAQAEVV